MPNRADKNLKPKSKSPNDLALIEAQAHALALDGELQEAAKTLLSVAKKQPQRIELWLQIAQWRREARAPKEAVATLQQALNLNAAREETEAARLWQAMAESFWDARDWEGCIGACAELLKRQPHSHSILELQATALLQIGRAEDAMKNMQLLLQLSPRDPFHRLRYATLLQLQGRSGDALREFQRVLNLYPDAPFVAEANEAVEALDAIQIQQILMMASEQIDFRQILQHEMELALASNGFHLSENGHESLRNMLGDGRVENEKSEPIRIH